MHFAWVTTTKVAKDNNVTNRQENNWNTIKKQNGRNIIIKKNDKFTKFLQSKLVYYECCNPLKIHKKKKKKKEKKMFLV